MNDDVKDFLTRCRTRYSPETLRGKSSNLQAYTVWLEARNLNYRTVTQSAIETFLHRCKDSQRKRTHYTLYRFHEFIDSQHNPAENIVVSATRRDPLPKRIPSRNVIERKIASLHGPREEITHRNRLIIELAYGSGLRRAEICMLDIEDVNLSDKTVYVRKGKGGKPRIVPVTPIAIETMREYLRERKATRGPLIVNYNRKKRMHPGGLAALVKKMTGYNTHAFRHACATHMLQAGCSLRYIQELLGHEGIGTTQIYTKVDTAQLSKVIRRTHPRAKPLVHF